MMNFTYLAVFDKPFQIISINVSIRHTYTHNFEECICDTKISDFTEIFSSHVHLCEMDHYIYFIIMNLNSR